jgi:hypothetical protein
MPKPILRLLTSMMFFVVAFADVNPPLRELSHLTANFSFKTTKALSLYEEPILEQPQIKILEGQRLDVSELKWSEGTYWGKTPGGWAPLLEPDQDKFNVEMDPDRPRSDRFKSALGKDLTTLVLQHAMNRTEAFRTLVPDETLIHLFVDHEKMFEPATTTCMLGNAPLWIYKPNLKQIMQIEGEKMRYPYPCDRCSDGCYNAKNIDGKCNLCEKKWVGCSRGQKYKRRGGKCHRLTSGRPNPHTTREECDLSLDCFWFGDPLKEDKWQQHCECKYCEGTGESHVLRHQFNCTQCKGRGSVFGDKKTYRCENLAPFQAFVDFCCDVCGTKDIEKGDWMMSCRKCGWDMCLDCKKKDDATRARPCICTLDDSKTPVFKRGRYTLTMGLGLFKVNKDISPNTDFLSALSLTRNGQPCNCRHGKLYRRNGFLPLAEDSSCNQCRGTGEVKPAVEEKIRLLAGKCSKGHKDHTTEKKCNGVSPCPDCILKDGTRIEQWMFCERCDASGTIPDGSGTIHECEWVRNHIDVTDTKKGVTGSIWGKTAGGWAKLYDGKTHQLTVTNALNAKNDCTKCLVPCECYRGLFDEKDMKVPDWCKQNGNKCLLGKCTGNGQLRTGVVAEPYRDACARCTACHGSRMGCAEMETETQRQVDDRLKDKPVDEWTYKDFGSFVYGFQTLDRDIKPRVTWVGYLVGNILKDSIEGDALVECLTGEDMYGDEFDMPDRPGLLRDRLDLESKWPQKVTQGLEVSDNFWSELFVTLYNIYKSQNDESWTPKTWKELCACAEVNDDL